MVPGEWGWGVKLPHGTEVPVDGTFVDFPLDDTLSSTVASWHRHRGVASLDSSDAWAIEDETDLYSNVGAVGPVEGLH